MGNLMSRAFTGGTSFMSNHYAIWREGIEDYRKVKNPNWYGIKQGNTYIDRMFYDRSMDKRASYYQFIEFLKKVEKKEAAKEKGLIEAMINKIIVANNGQPTKSIQLAQRAVSSEDYGLAYFFLVQNEKEIDSFIDEVLNNKKTQNISHTNLFWDHEFFKHLSASLRGWLNNINTNKINTSLTVEEIVDGWIAQATLDSSGIVPQSLYDMRKSMVERLKEQFESRDLLLSSSTTKQSRISSSKLKKYLQADKYAKTPTGRSRSIDTMCNILGKEMAFYLARGMGQELSQTGKQGRYGVAFNTGMLRKEIEKVASKQRANVSITNDVISFVGEAATIDIEAIVQDAQLYAEDEVAEVIAEVETRLQKLAQESDTRLFKVVTNVKGYQSRFDLQIKKDGNFAQRSVELERIAREAQGLPAFSMDKIQFMLNNTIPGCINENRAHHIIDYIAAICVAYMWDDYTALMSVEEQDNSIDTVHIFSSGAIYYSASQIMRQTREDLENQVSRTSFVNITITPPTFDAEAEYIGLQQKYPVEGVNDHQENQNLLAKRWDEMRDKVATQGKISIDFKQRELENIISDIKGILKL